MPASHRLRIGSCPKAGAPGVATPAAPLYRVELLLDVDPGLSPRHWRGHVVIALPGRSGWDRAWSAASEVLARELGF
jgi:hypothetical protein